MKTQKCFLRSVSSGYLACACYGNIMYYEGILIRQRESFVKKSRKSVSPSKFHFALYPKKSALVCLPDGSARPPSVASPAGTRDLLASKLPRLARVGLRWAGVWRLPSPATRLRPNCSCTPRRGCGMLGRWLPAQSTPRPQLPSPGWSW